MKYSKNESRQRRKIRIRKKVNGTFERPRLVVFRSNLHIYAAMRGESLEDFQKTRNAPGALYSVAGKDAGTLAWSK